MFANKYLEKKRVSALIPQTTDPALGISVVIPCFREPEVLKTLKSLLACRLPSSGVEIILLINHSENASEEVKNQNLATKKEVERWISTNQKAGLNFFAAGPVELKKNSGWKKNMRITRNSSGNPDCIFNLILRR